jgi:hypothetical protein
MQELAITARARALAVFNWDMVTEKHEQLFQFSQ